MTVTSRFPTGDHVPTFMLFAILTSLVFPTSVAVAEENFVYIAKHDTRLAEHWQQKVDEQFKKIHQGLTKFDVPPLVRKDQAIPEFQALIKKLKGPGNYLVQNYGGFKEAVATLQQQLSTSVTSLNAASEQLKKKAQTMRHEDNKKQYLLMADEAVREAARRKAQVVALSDRLKVVDKEIDYVRESLIVLDAIDTFLAVYPSKASRDVTQYLATLEAYITRYRRTIGSFSDLRSLGERPKEKPAKRVQPLPPKNPLKRAEHKAAADAVKVAASKLARLSVHFVSFTTSNTVSSAVRHERLAHPLKLAPAKLTLVKMPPRVPDMPPVHFVSFITSNTVSSQGVTR